MTRSLPFFISSKCMASGQQFNKRGNRGRKVNELAAIDSFERRGLVHEQVWTSLQGASLRTVGQLVSLRSETDDKYASHLEQAGMDSFAMTDFDDRLDGFRFRLADLLDLYRGKRRKYPS